MVIRDRLTDGSVQLTRSDAKVARTLLANYPAAGLNTVAALAAAAGVSSPTVVRFVIRMGFESYAHFQKALLDEVQQRMSSPLAMINAGKGRQPPDSLYQDSIRAAVLELEAVSNMVPIADFEACVAAVADTSLRIQCIGGRFSGYLAGMLWAHLRQLRSDCFWINGARADQADALVDIGRRDVVVAYDYRRYQVDTIEFALAAAEQGARIILFTDRWQSPIAAHASTILIAPVEGPSPFDTMLPALAQTEALILAVMGRLAGPSRDRIEKTEALRRKFKITEDLLGAEQGDTAIFADNKTRQGPNHD